MKLYAARHGETTYNVEKRVLGSTPGELTSNGIEQASELARHVETLGLDRAYSSDLARTVATITNVAILLPNLDIVYTKELRERDFGLLEGQLRADVDWDGFWSLPSDSKEYEAESLDDFTRRIAKFIVDLSCTNDETVGLFSHIGVMNRLNYLTDPSTFDFIDYPNADVVEFDYEKLLCNGRKFV